MNSFDLIRHRLINQQIAETKFKRPEQIVSWMIAMQAQEYAMARWAIGLRLPGSTDGDVEKALDQGKILRTHVMRPTWHFVTPADIRWLLALTAPRVHAASAYMYRQSGLDSKIFNKSIDVIARALEGERHLTRTELQSLLKEKNIVADGFKLGYIMMNAELEAVVCSGKRRGKQFTYALIDERAPQSKLSVIEDARSELLLRYLISRGPATLQDFCTWSGLTLKDAQAGFESIQSKLVAETIDGKKYWLAKSSPAMAVKAAAGKLSSFLMPDYDEYGMSYKDRSAILDKEDLSYTVSRGNPVFNRMIILEGKIAGTWKQHVEKKKMRVETVPFRPLTKSHQFSLSKATDHFIRFLCSDLIPNA